MYTYIYVDVQHLCTDVRVLHKLHSGKNIRNHFRLKLLNSRQLQYYIVILYLKWLNDLVIDLNVKK